MGHLQTPFVLQRAAKNNRLVAADPGLPAIAFVKAGTGLSEAGYK
jgi:hypothetical protein